MREPGRVPIIGGGGGICVLSGGGNFWKTLTWKTKKVTDEIKISLRTVVRMRGGWERLTVVPQKFFFCYYYRF
jgi:hypothetical protein